MIALDAAPANSTDPLPATTTLSAAARSQWDALVIGAGPAGALAAQQLAKRGAQVLLVEKTRFPRYKVCGGCLNAAGLATLEACGLGDLVRACGAPPLSRAELVYRGQRVNITLPGGAAISRAALDSALVRAAVSAGASFLPETTAALAELNNTHRVVSLSSSTHECATVGAGCVVVADGLGGRTLRPEPGAEVAVDPRARIGAGVMLVDEDPRFPAGVVTMAAARGGYVGIARVEHGQLDIAAAFDAELVRQAGGVGRAAMRVLAEAQVASPRDLETASWRGTPRLTCRRALRSAPRLLVAGDATGYVEPFTGEGMAWALASGRAAANLLDADAIADWPSTVGRRWDNFQRRLGRRQRTCRVVSFILHRPWLMSAAQVLLSHRASLAQPWVWRINQPLS